MGYSKSIRSMQIDDGQVGSVRTSHPENIVSSFIETGDIPHVIILTSARAHPHQVTGKKESKPMHFIPALRNNRRYTLYVEIRVRVGDLRSEQAGNFCSILSMKNTLKISFAARHSSVSRIAIFLYFHRDTSIFSLQFSRAIVKSCSHWWVQGSEGEF